MATPIPEPGYGRQCVPAIEPACVVWFRGPVSLNLAVFISLVHNVREGRTVPATEVADQLPHRVDGSEHVFRPQQREVEVGLHVLSHCFSAPHEEAVPDEVVVGKVMPRKVTIRSSRRATGGAAGSCSI